MVSVCEGYVHVEVTLHLMLQNESKSIPCADGCELEDHTELDLGEVLKISCPCEEYLQNLLNDQEALRVCGGTYTTGAQLLDTDFSQCVTATNDVTSGLCHATMVCIVPVFVYAFKAYLHICNLTPCHYRRQMIIHWNNHNL